MKKDTSSSKHEHSFAAYTDHSILPKQIQDGNRLNTFMWSASNGNGNGVNGGNGGGVGPTNKGNFYISHAYLVNKTFFYNIVVVRARPCLSMYSLLKIPASKLLVLEMVVCR